MAPQKHNSYIHHNSHHTQALAVRRKAKEARKRRVWFILLWVVLIIGVITLVTLSVWGSWFKINSVEVSMVSKEEIVDVKQNEKVLLEVKKQITDTLNKKIFFFIPQDTVFAFLVKRNEKVVLERYPELDGIEISRQGLHVLMVTLMPRIPVAYVCNRGSVIQTVKNTTTETAKDLSQEGKCNYLDKTGLVFTSVSTNDSAPSLFLEFPEIVFPASTTAYKLYGKPLNSEDLKGLLSIMDMLKGFNMYVHTIDSGGYDGYNLIVNVKDGEVSLYSFTLSVAKGLPMATSLQNVYTFLSKHIHDPEKKNVKYDSINAKYNPAVYYTTQ